ncbi:MAG: hypothetical protein ACI35W_04300 [Anaeroplasmataceae bacterium]
MANKIDKSVDEKKLKAPKKLKILFTIVQREKADFYLDVLQGFDVNLQTMFYGRGTLPKELSGFLDVAGKEKAIIMSVVREDNIKEILCAYEDKYFKIKHASGIAFTIPLSSMIGKMAYEFLANLKEEK